MKTQDILARVYDAMRPFDAVKSARDSRDYNAEGVMRDMYDGMRLIAADLEAQLRSEIAASKGTGSALKTITAILKANAKSARPGLAYPWIDAEGRQCVCDGYQAYRLREHLPLVERPEDAGPGIDLGRIFPRDLNGWKSFPMPSQQELRAFIAQKRAAWQGKRNNFVAVWSFGQQAPAVNAEKLLNAAIIFPDAEKILWNTIFSPLMIITERGDAMIMPMRIQGNTQPEPTSDAEREAIEREKAETKERNAHQTAAYYREKSVEYVINQTHALNVLEEASVCGDEAKAAKATEDYFDACEREANALLHYHAAATEADPTHMMDLDELSRIMGKYYVRELNAA